MSEARGSNSLRILERWFVLYNPFYLASACLTLSGARELSAGIAEMHWGDGRIVPAAVLGLYQMLLGVGAIVVAGRGSRRAAVILALVASLFVVDPTFQHVAIAIYARRFVGIAAAVISIAISAGVVLAILRALRLRLSPSSLTLALATVSGIALGPHLLDSGMMSRGRGLLLLASYGIGVASLLYMRPLRIVLDADRSGDEWSITVARRASRYLTALFPMAFAAHLVAWCRLFDIHPDYRLGLLLSTAFVVAAREEAFVWAGAFIGMLIALSHPPVLGATALTFAIVLFLRWRLGMSYRLGLAAIIGLWIAVTCFHWHGGDFPAAAPWATVAAVVSLGALAFTQHKLAPLLGALVITFATDWGTSSLGAAGRGLVLLIAGFILLGAGVAVNLYLSDGRT